MTTTNALFEFVPGLPVEELRQELDLANTVTALGKRKLARCLFDMQERGVFAMSGHGSACHYASAKLGMQKRCAQDYLVVGKRLEELHVIDAALVNGEISWSKMKVILRVVVPETEREWLERADASNCDKLSFDVSRCEKGDRPKQDNGGGLTEVRMTVRASLRLFNHQLWEQAKRKVSAELGIRITNEDMMIQAARLILSTDADGKAEGRTVVKHSPFQLIVHQDAEGTRVHTDQGDVEIRPDQAERLVAQAEIVPAAKPVADPDGKTPMNLIRRVLAHDNYRCRNCQRTLYLQVHHIEFRSQGGKTEEGLLVAVCGRCHGLLHQGLLHLVGDAKGGFVFLDRSGAAVEAKRAPIPAEIVAKTFVHTTPAPGPEAHKDNLGRRLMTVRARQELAPRPEFRQLPGSFAHSYARDWM